MRPGRRSLWRARQWQFSDDEPKRRIGCIQDKENVMLSWQVGAVKITSVVEMVMSVPYDPQGFFLRGRESLE